MKFINFIYNEYKVTFKIFSQIYMFFFYCFDKVLTSENPKIMTFSITGT